MKKYKGQLGEFFYSFRYGTIMVAVGFIVTIWDLVTKMITDGKSYSLIDGVVSVSSSHNTGAAWSILNQHTWLLILISVIFIILLILANIYFFKNKNYLYATAMGLILSGAICNLFDRIAFGYVRDFISLEFINFPIFNIADIAITIGVILLCAFFLFCSKKEKDGQQKTNINNQKANNNE